MRCINTEIGAFHACGGIDVVACAGPTVSVTQPANVAVIVSEPCPQGSPSVMFPSHA
jgi:hypothetical protein